MQTDIFVSAIIARVPAGGYELVRSGPMVLASCPTKVAVQSAARLLGIEPMDLTGT